MVSNGYRYHQMGVFGVSITVSLNIVMITAYTEQSLVKLKHFTGRKLRFLLPLWGCGAEC